MTLLLLWEGNIKLDRKKYGCQGIVDCDRVHAKVFKNLDNNSSFMTCHFNIRLVLNATINNLTPLHRHGPTILNFGLLNVVSGDFRIYCLTFEDNVSSATFEGAIRSIKNGKLSILTLLFVFINLYSLMIHICLLSLLCQVTQKWNARL